MRLLAGVKAATGGARWDHVHTWHERGTFQAGDLTGDYEMWLDFRQFRSYTEVRNNSAILGSVRRISGWTGKVSWLADQTGDIRIEDSEAARREGVGSTYFSAFGYLFPSRYPAKTELLAPETADGKPCDVVRITPGDADPTEIWIDRSAHRVVRSLPVTGPDTTPTVFSDFRRVAGLTVPFKRVDLGRASDPEQTTQVTSIEINRAVPAGLFDAPRAHFTDVYFPANQDSVTLDFRLVAGQIRVPVSLNGRRFEDFLFDTGSTNSIDPDTARSLGLKVEIAGKEYGAGTDAAQAGLTRVDRLELGALRFDKQIFTAVKSASDDVAGSIGYEAIVRTVVVIDYTRNRITFLKPSAFRPPAQAIALPFRFSGTLVLVEAAVDGDPGEFIIDTAGGASLLIFRPFAERHGLLEKHRAGHEVQANGIGGSAPVVLFRPDRFTIGPLHPPAPVGGILLTPSGAGALEHVAGDIGNGVLKRFTVTLDYAHRVLYLEPNSSFQDPDVCTVGWTGLSAGRNAGSGRVEVIEVENDSPAAQAGIRKGDGILAVNGASLDSYSDDQLRDAFTAAPGTVFVITIQREGGTRQVELTAKPLI